VLTITGEAPIHILYVHQLFSTRGGAVGTRSYEVARRMVERGHAVTVVCGSYANAATGIETPFINGRREGLVDGIRVVEYNVPTGNKMSFLARAKAFADFIRRSLREVLRENYDVIYATSTPLTVAIHGIMAKLIRRKIFIFEVRDLWPELPKAMGVITNPLVLMAMSALEWTAYRTADACVGLSPGIVEGIRQRAGDKKEILFAPNAADLEFFAKTREQGIEIEGIRQSDFVAIFSGTHGIANGLDNVLDAAGVLMKNPQPEARRIRFVFIGDGGQKERLVARAQKEGLANCLFLDPVPKISLRRYLGRADVGIMALQNVKAFYFGTSPNKFFDYIAAGLPVICNYPGWVSEMIVENQCGEAVLPGDPEAFARTIIKMSRSTSDLQAMRLQSRRLAERDFDRDAICNHIVNFVEKTARQ
jgi:glycosyltransferase involved in cell wall biosynthesis